MSSSHRPVIAPARAIVALALAIALLAAAAPSARAASAPFALDSATPDLVKAATGWTVDVGLTNLTDRPLTIAAIAADRACRLDFGGAPFVALPAARHTTATVSVPAGCKADDPRGLPFAIGVRGLRLRVVARATSPKKVDWSPLLMFLWLGAGSFAAVLAVAGVWLRGASDANLAHIAGGSAPTRWRVFGRCLAEPLDGLKDSWSFKDSWLSNLTAASGVLIVVFASTDSLKAVLGSAQEDTLAVMAVAGAIGTALTGVAGVAVITVRRVRDPSAASYVTIGGLLLGAAIGLAGASGQVWSVTVLLRSLVGGETKTLILVAAIAATVLLAAYTWTSLGSLLTAGTRPPSKRPSDRVPTEVYSAAIVATAEMHQTVDKDAVEDLLRRLEEEHPRTPIANRSALL